MHLGLAHTHTHTLTLSHTLTPKPSEPNQGRLCDDVHRREPGVYVSDGQRRRPPCPPAQARTGPHHDHSLPRKPALLSLFVCRQHFSVRVCCVCVCLYSLASYMSTIALLSWGRLAATPTPAEMGLCLSLCDLFSKLECCVFREGSAGQPHSHYGKLSSQCSPQARLERPMSTEAASSTSSEKCSFGAGGLLCQKKASGMPLIWPCKTRGNV